MPETNNAGAWGRGAVLFLLAAFFAAAARLTLIHSHGMDVPYLDQWDDEGSGVYIPYEEGQLGLRDILFRPHNQHYTVLTRLTALALWCVNQQWDGRLQMVVGSIAFVLFWFAWGRALWRQLGYRHVVPLALTVGLLAALPFGWENTLWGFQNQVYYLVGFSVAAIHLVMTSRALTVRWWLGVGAALIALFTMGSGFMAAAALIPALFCKAWLRRDWRSGLLGMLACSAVLILGLSLEQRVLTATDIYWRNLALALANHLAWPFSGSPALVLVCWLPSLITICWFLRGRLHNQTAAALVLATALWCVLQAMAFVSVNVMRGHQGAFGPASRYMDMLAPSLAVNVFAAWVMLDEARDKRRRVGTRAFMIWFVTMCCGYLNVSFGENRQGMFRWYINDQARQTKAVRDFIRTDDPSVLPDLTFSPAWDKPIPYWNAARFVLLLREPVLRDALPVSVRAPLPVQPDSDVPQTFTVDGYNAAATPPGSFPTWGSFDPLDGDAHRGYFLSAVCEPGSRSHLVFDFTGFLGASDKLHLRLLAADGSWTRAIVPGGPAWREWARIVVKQPTAPFRIEAIDDDQTGGWFAFTAPREMGRLTRISEAVLARAPKLLYLAVGLLLAAVMGATLQKEPTTSNAPV